MKLGKPDLMIVSVCAGKMSLDLAHSGDWTPPNSPVSVRILMPANSADGIAFIREAQINLRDIADRFAELTKDWTNKRDQHRLPDGVFEIRHRNDLPAGHVEVVRKP
jgi:hypothetical protein